MVCLVESPNSPGLVEAVRKKIETKENRKRKKKEIGVRKEKRRGKGKNKKAKNVLVSTAAESVAMAKKSCKPPGVQSNPTAVRCLYAEQQLHRMLLLPTYMCILYMAL